MTVKNKGLFNTSDAGLLILLVGMLCAGSARLVAQDEAPAGSLTDEAVSAPAENESAPFAVKGEGVTDTATLDAVGNEIAPVAVPSAVPVVIPVAAPVATGSKSISGVRLLSECDDIPGLRKALPPFVTEGMDIVKFINMIADDVIGGDLNIVVSTRVTGVVRLTLKGVTVGEALEIALADNRLACEVKGSGPRSIIRVMTDEEYRIDHGVSYIELRKVKVIDLKHAKPTRMITALSEMKSSIGKIIADDASGTLVMIDTPAKIAEMESLVMKSEFMSPTVTRVFRLQYADLVELNKVVVENLTKDIGKVTINTKTKSLIVTDLANNVVKIADMIKAFDRRPKEVAIEAQIVEVELTDDFSMGVNWKHVLKGINPRFNLISGAPLSAGVSPTLRYDTIIAGGGELSLVIDALKTVGNTKVLSKPQISVQDGEPATIKVVKNQPWKKVAFESGTTNIVGVDYQFIEIGTTLAVTPIINDEGFITVSIKPTISTLDGWYDAPPGSEGVVGIPVVKKSEASTSVMVKDGVTIIIGGMIKTEKRVNRLGVPILGSIPLLGRLFRSDSEKSVKTETIVFLTPRIITGEEPFLQMPDVDRGLKFRTGGDSATNAPKTDVEVSGKEIKVRTE